MQDKMAHLPSGHHLVRHHPLGIRTQLGDHGKNVFQLGQGCLDPFIALGGTNPPSPLGRIVNHEQGLTGVQGVQPCEENFT